MKIKWIVFSFFIATVSVQPSFSQHAARLGATYRLTLESSSASQQFGADIPTYFKFRAKNRYLEAGFSDFTFSGFNSNQMFPSDNFGFILTPFVEIGRLVGNADKKLAFKVGSRFDLSNTFQRRKPNIDTEFKSSSFTSAVTYAIAPGILYRLGERLSLDVSIPFQLITIHTDFYRWDNPLIPVANQRGNHGLEGELLPNTYQLRIGFIYKLGN